MNKTTTRAGYIAYEVTMTDMIHLGHPGICDNCGRIASWGFLIPVTDGFYCTRCFEEWDSFSNFYPEDVPLEYVTAKFYEAKLGGWHQ